MGALTALPALGMSSALAATAPPAPAKVKPAPVLADQWDGGGDNQLDDSSGSYDPTADPGSLYSVTTAIGARALWKQNDATGRAITGNGVTVALLDSGVAPVAGLNGTGKILPGPDLSLETNSAALQGLDSFGHGTHLAGIIAGRDATTTAKNGTPTPVSASQQLGVAPDARLLPVKLASADGSTDVSQVIAGLDWVTEHANDPGVGIRVVNLAFGTDSVQPAQIDPLAAAAENAWHHGIVVVVSGGNEGATTGGLTDPAIDPYVIAVGASDPLGSVAGWKAPGVATFSSVGNSTRAVDLVAPGRSISSLRDPGSFVDVNHPEGLVAGDSTGRLFRGSGTSQASAVVSGAVALLLQADPGLTPDQVKAALVASAVSLSGVTPLAQGAGELNVAQAAALVRTYVVGGKAAAASPLQPAAAAQTFPVATGLGSLEAARGGSHLIDPDNGIALIGEMDVQGQPWVPATWAAASAAGTAWSGGLWNGARWSGDSWSSSGWSGARWSGARWSGARWSDADWDAASWTSARWSGAVWDSARWSGAAWDSARWSGQNWD